MQDKKLRTAIEIVTKALDISEDELGPDSSMENTPSWDSMGHMSVCMEFERRFGKLLDLDKILTISSVRELATFVP